MSNKIGQFEILSEITRSPSGSVYKANDTENGQTLALKVFNLEAFGEQAAEFGKQALEEAAGAKALNSPNLAVLHGAGEADNQYYASLEYVQGNSVATMLARNEGFSIWDLQDIARQTCQGLDHAHAKGLFHCSLEPSKIMVTWDGTVKILGFGTSRISALAAQADKTPQSILHYMSPEQLRGEPLDARSNLFSLGAILYEMVSERKAFDGENAEQVRQQIAEHSPVAPIQLNEKIHPALNELIIKALSKAPEERYQSGQELVTDLEKCRERPVKAVVSKPAQGLNVPQKQQAASGSTAAARPAAARTQVNPAPNSLKPAARVPEQAHSAVGRIAGESQPEPPAGVTPRPAPAARAAAAAAGAHSAGVSARTLNVSSSQPVSETPVLEAAVEAVDAEQAVAADVVVEPELESPTIAIDPTMDESKSAQITGPSFSDISELPPLKEVYIAPPSPPEPPEPPELPEPVEPVKPAVTRRAAVSDKPKVPPREVAKKAVREIKKTPPKLFAYSLTAALAIILLVTVGIVFHIHNENADEDSGAAQPVSGPAASAPAAAPAQPATPATAEAAQTAPAAEVAQEQATEQPEVSVEPRRTAKKKRQQRSAPVAIPGQLTLNSTPEGAQVHVDGNTDPNWITPYTVTGLTAGQHTISVSKPGYASDTRTVDVAAGSKSFLAFQLQQLTATLAVTSTPAGAEVFLDGKDTGHVTPAHIPVSKPGNHSIVVKKQGYLEETTSVNLQAGQTAHFSPSLRTLGNADDIKMAGRFKKLFGRGDTAGMGKVSIKTNPKGAQIAVNRRIVDKPSPVEFYLNPGTYVIDITQSGYKNIHRVINVEQDGKLNLDETMQPE